MRVVRLQDEDFKFLQRLVEKWTIRCRDNFSAYVEYADTFERLRFAMESSDYEVSDQDPPPPTKKPRAKRGEKAQFDPKLCPTHPKYGAKRVPRTDCDGCWSAYARLNPTNQRALRKRRVQ